MEGLIFVLGALVVGALGVGIGILVAPRLTHFAERADEADEGAEDGAVDVPGEVGADWPVSAGAEQPAAIERKDEPPGDDRA